jgi:hypothetical protein
MASVASAQPVSVAAFQSLQSRNGAHVTVRYGQAQRVQILSGAPKISVNGDGRLTIDNHDALRGTRADIEIVTPSLKAFAVEQGGRLTVEAGFPRQSVIAAAVANGGVLDLRRLPVDQVSAAVSQGGMIAVRPARQLSAAINHGGNITYWGTPSVSTSIQHGGAVARGRAEDEDRPFGQPAERHRP